MSRPPTHPSELQLGHTKFCIFTRFRGLMRPVEKNLENNFSTPICLREPLAWRCIPSCNQAPKPSSASARKELCRIHQSARRMASLFKHFRSSAQKVTWVELDCGELKAQIGYKCDQGMSSCLTPHIPCQCKDFLRLPSFTKAQRHPGRS